MFVFWAFGELAGVLGIFYAVAVWKLWMILPAAMLYFICRVKLDRYR